MSRLFRRRANCPAQFFSKARQRKGAGPPPDRPLVLNQKGVFVSLRFDAVRCRWLRSCSARGPKDH